MTSLASTLPNSNTGYVAAAYIVFLAIVLIYVSIMAVRLGRVERRVQELHDTNRDNTPPAREGPSAVEDNSPRFERPDQERETV